MQLKRLFTNQDAKGTENYLNIQKKYELARTVLMFGISLSLFAAGFLQTGTRLNLLTVVAVLGCLPASRSLVNTIMFLRYKSGSSDTLTEIKKHTDGLQVLFDCVFTSYQKNYQVCHMAICGNTVCGYTEDKEFDENGFNKHIGNILKTDGHNETTVKIFKELSKYCERLEQLKKLEESPAKTEAVINTIKSVIL
ncbi:MAG: hypothetical protein ACI4HQ_07710 [Acetatifactor sp.]